MNAKEEYFILYEAYEHYRKTGITILLYLLNDASISLHPLEEMSFDITLSGIRFIETRRES